ncbi:MAG: M14 family zinc carboxypeptidase, partial [Ignavibacteria bacterium]
MKKCLLISLVFFMSLNTSTAQREKLTELVSELKRDYSRYKVTQIETRRFDVKNFNKILDSLLTIDTQNFHFQKIGSSFKGREIKLIRFGEGEIKILMWSQMHGDESTASLALLDLINLLIINKDLADELKSKISLYIIPILNPDGANQFERRNYQEIDINRDALRLQTPEGRILKKVRDEIEPDFAFNLHDQYTTYSVGRTGKPAAIALLAPAFDYERNVNQIRERAIKVCVEIKEIIDRFYPGVVARYDDEFEPRAFGDNFQKWGSSTILIESGGYLKDYEKQEIRKMNFLALAGSIYSIANQLYNSNSIDEYFKIPENQRSFFDLLVKNVKMRKDSLEYIVDLGINYTEKFDSLRNRFVRVYSISDLGDLSTFYGFDTLDANYLIFDFGKVYEKIISDYDQLVKIDLISLIKEGYTTIIYQGDFGRIEEGSLLDQTIST